MIVARFALAVLTIGALIAPIPAEGQLVGGGCSGPGLETVSGEPMGLGPRRA